MRCLLVAALVCVATATRYEPYANYTKPVIDVLDKTLQLMANDGNVTEDCRFSTSSLVKGAGNGAIWALRFIDASGKPSSGLLGNPVVMPGFFTECVETVIGNESGKYCLMTVNSPSADNNQDDNKHRPWNVLKDKNSKIALCVPSICTNEDVKYAMQKAITTIANETKVEMSKCYTKENGFSEDPAAITMTAILCLFLLLVFVATVYDIVKESKGPIEGYINKTVAATSTDTIPNTTSSSEILCERKNAKSHPSQLENVLLCFSFRKNGKEILHTGKTEGSIDALHGIRVISMLWIISGHTTSFGYMWLFLRTSPNTNTSNIGFGTQIIANGTLAVDTFLYLSGFLVVYGAMKRMKRNDGKLNVIEFYFHRYLRMTPLMMAIIGFCACIIRYVNRGPQWLDDISMYDAWCKENWWLNLLYVQNFINTPNMCLSHSWYSAVDMQLYLITPIIIYALYKGRKYGFSVIAMFMIFTVTITATLTAIYNYPAIPYISDIVSVSHMDDYFDTVYIKPYCRLGPYLVGMLVGYFFYDWTEPINLNKYWALIGWMACIATNLFIVYSMWPANKGILPTVGEASAYSALARTVWAVTLAWVTFACVTGHGGFINTFLSWRPLIPFSRLTYSVYLIHPVLMAMFYGSRETVFDLSPYFTIYLVSGNILLSYVISFLLSAMFESPIIRLEKILIRKT